MPRIKLHHINRLLLAAIITVNVYVIALPALPAIIFWWQNHINHRNERLTELISSDKSSSRAGTPKIPDGEHLIIPSIALNELVHEGASKYTVNKGVWRFPSSSTPDKASNTVLIGHRFTYQGTSVFYNLNLVKPGDKIGVFWNQKKYLYTVTETKVVPPSDIEIEKPTTDSRLTLYTCTPMWSAKNRLVIIAQRDVP